MLVHGAIFPPRTALDAVAEVLRSVAAAEPAPATAKGIFGRLGRHRVEADESADALPGMLERVPVERMQFPITGFGNLTPHDANRVADAIIEASADWPTPTVRFAGGTALDFPGDWSVWAKLDGDVDDLLTVTRGVTQCVQGLGFFVDRRQFRPMLSVATVTPATTGPYLQEVVDAFEAFRGEEWTVGITLTKEAFVDGKPQQVEFRRIALTH